MGRQALIVKMSGVWICVSGESAHFAFQSLLRLFVFSWFRVFVRCDMRLGSTKKCTAQPCTAQSVYKKVLQTERAADRDCFTAFVQRQHLYGCTRSCDCGQTVDSQ